ncbi:MAG: class I SAM-dependent methyltransferase [Deltaproteobacteria bacterium]|nr:MAG: class I SAM-dependent methyltransferase [Deltaproteobacteria bacterium]
MDYRQRIYDRYATVFKDRSDAFDKDAVRRWGRAYLSYLNGWLPSDKQSAIADLACGHGNLLFFFQEQGYTNLSGVDISPDQVQIARNIAPSVEEGDLLAFLRSHPNTFDLLTGLDIIEHFTKDEAITFLDECYKALKPGGRLILQTPNATNPLNGIIRYGDFTHEVCFQEDVLARLMTLSGFQKPESREMGPVKSGYSLKSSVRYMLWRGLRMGYRLANMIETGTMGPEVWTRVFLISAVKA